MRASILLAAVPFVNPGCDRTCSGPACEAEYTATRLAFRAGGERLADGEAWDGADRLFDGTASAGTDWALALAIDRLVIGRPDPGEVDLVDGDLLPLETWTGSGGFGGSLAVTDADADGRWDLWVGAPRASLDRGSLHLFRNAANRGGLDEEEADLTLRSWTPGDRLGHRVAPCPDLTGDGRPDLLVGMPGLSAPASDALEGGDVPSLAGGVVLVRSERVARASGEVGPTDLGPVWWGTSIGGGAGTAVDCSADLDGDGVVDLVVGAPLHEVDDRGVTYVVDGAALPDSGPLPEVAIRVVEGGRGDWLGASVGTGDLDGDGAPDLAIGAPGSDAARGAVAVVSGASLREGDAVLAVVVQAAPERDGRDRVGASLAVGDLDADGVDDLVVGAPGWQEESVLGAGRVSIWYGRDGWSGAPRFDRDADTVLTGTRSFQRVGAAALIDLDRDGVDDLLLPTAWRGY